MADSQISKTNIIKNNLKYFLQSFVIILSIFISFFFEDVRKNKEDILTKNELVSDLIISLDEDLIQIDNLLEILQDSEKNILEILNDIDLNHKNLTDLEAIKIILDTEVGISFFPKDGIFEQLISTGTFELIKNNELKKLLLEMFNHQKDRNYATSTEISELDLATIHMMANFMVQEQSIRLILIWIITCQVIFTVYCLKLNIIQICICVY